MKNTIKQTIKTECFLVSLLFKTDTCRAVLYWCLTGVKYAIPLLGVWIWKLILDELTLIYQTHAASHVVWVYLSIYLVLQVIASVITRLNSVIYEKIERKATYHMDMAIMRKMTEIDTAFFDDPGNSAKLKAANTSESYITGNMCWAVDTIIRLITFVSGMIVFLSYDPLLGFMYMATYIPGAIISYRHKTKVDQWSIDNIPETRKKNYYKALLTSPFAAKDLRLYNLADYFKDKYNSLCDKIRSERARLFVKGSVASFLASLLTYSGIVVMIILSVRSVLHGAMAIGTLATYIGLAGTTGENFATIIEDLACQVEIDVPHVIKYMDFLKYENTIRDDGTERIPLFPDIEFRNVCFQYPGNEEYTIKNLNLKIKGGSKIALIGVNGAGKTTIIKLLLRFYEPQSGEILLGGKSIKCYPLEELHNMFGVCFQDVNHYSLSLRENIAISDIRRKSDDEAVYLAAKASGADRIIETLENGLNTDMTRKFNDKGAELSGGQWQKVALARAFFRDSQFVILDESSSALDPEAEDYIFSSFKRLCENKGGILVSHRLSSIMMVDEIFLLDDGAVIESGTHAELMRQDGKYAQMYRMQAEKYTGGVDHE